MSRVQDGRSSYRAAPRACPVCGSTYRTRGICPHCFLRLALEPKGTLDAAAFQKALDETEERHPGF